VFSDEGTIFLEMVESPATLPSSVPVGFLYEKYRSSHVMSERGFGFGAIKDSSTFVLRRAWMPYWALMLVTAPLAAALPIKFARRMRRRHRHRKGLCLRCGYDLRASTDRCPECGAAIPARTRADATPS
jgi:hypothetical protein